MTQKKPSSNPTAPTIFYCPFNIVKLVSPQPAESPHIQAQVRLAVAAVLQEVLTALTAGRPLTVQAPAEEPLTVVAATNEFLRAKARAGRSDAHLKRLIIALKSFAKGRAEWPLANVTTKDLEKWAFEGGWASKTARNYLTDISGLFNYAVRRGYIGRNPAHGLELPDPRSSAPIVVHTPDQVRTVLEAARAADLDVCRVLAVRYFCGVRTSEAHKLTEANLKLEENLLEVPAEYAKTRRRRLVTIKPNLRAWLDLGGVLRPMSPMTVRRIIKLSGVEWPPNVTRHSYVSYHLAVSKSSGATALEAGHSEQMLFSNYRALVTPASAAEYWAIVPEKGKAVQDGLDGKI